jgi:hypothetical protein
MASDWKGIISYVRTSQPAHVNTFVQKELYVHPLQDGFILSFGDSKDPIPHYRKTLPDGSGVHVLEYSNGYLLHWDYVDAITNPIGHIQFDAPQHLPFLNAAICFGIARVILAGLSLLGSKK